MKVKYGVMCAALVAAFSATPDAKAEPMTHDGFYMSIEAGLGYLSSSADYLGSEITFSSTTFSSALLLGGTVGPVALGGGFIYDYGFSPSAESGGQEAELEDVKLYLVSIGAFADYYVDPAAGGLHFLGFLGWGALESSSNGNAGGSDPTGLAVTLGGGYDWWVADEWSIGPLARFTYAPLSLDNIDYSTWNFSAVADFKFH